MKAIFLKEFIRLRLFFLFLFTVLVLFFAWFSFDLDYKLHPIHPETVVWYEYVFFDKGPEFITFLVIVAVFACVGLAQFLPQRNQMRCMLHLPMSGFKILIFHYCFAFLFFALIWIVFGVWLWIAASEFYPDIIVREILINWCYFCLCAVAVYLMTSCAAMDQKVVRAVSCGLIFVLVCSVLVFYIDSFLVAIFLITGSVVLGFNSLISHKQISLNVILLQCLYLSFLSIGAWNTYKIYEEKFTNKSEKYYIFYSPTLKEFVFQENLGGHYFSYRSASGKVFDDEFAYKNELAFNYYMDLKQQNKLPVNIDGELFDENKIRAARMSMSFTPSDIKTPKIPLYPLLNPNPKVSAIPFGDNMIYFARGEIKIYHHDKDDHGLNENLNDKIKNADIKFPVVGVFGRFTNLKAFDAGIFFKDSAGEFFNIRLYDDKFYFQRVENLRDFDYLHISENKESDFMGLGFKEGRIYLISKNYDVKQLEVGRFDYLKMRLRVSFDPKYLQVRFDDGKDYRAYVFDRDSFEKIDEIYLKAK